MLRFLDKEFGNRDVYIYIFSSFLYSLTEGEFVTSFFAPQSLHVIKYIYIGIVGYLIVIVVFNI